eukprot:696699-Amphidinium_carterae.1
MKRGQDIKIGRRPRPRGTGVDLLGIRTPERAHPAVTTVPLQNMHCMQMNCRFLQWNPLMYNDLASLAHDSVERKLKFCWQTAKALHVYTPACCHFGNIESIVRVDEQRHALHQIVSPNLATSLNPLTNHWSLAHMLPIDHKRSLRRNGQNTAFSGVKA